MSRDLELRHPDIDALLRERDRLRAKVAELEHENRILRDAHRRTWEQFSP